MKSHAQPCLVILDGGLASLSAAWTAGVCGGAPSRTAGGFIPALQGSAASVRLAHARHWADLCTLAAIVERCDVPEPSAIVETEAHSDERTDDAPTPVSRIGFEQSVLLLAACHEALSHGISRVVWPIHIGDIDGLGGPDQPPPLDLIADACDRAMLASQLASVDAGRASMGVTIELPYVDFTDKQMLELALDLGVPMSAGWWCDRAAATTPREAQQPCGQCKPCSRWQRALSAASPGAALVQVLAGMRKRHAQTSV